VPGSIECGEALGQMTKSRPVAAVTGDHCSLSYCCNIENRVPQCESK